MPRAPLTSAASRAVRLAGVVVLFFGVLAAGSPFGRTSPSPSMSLAAQLPSSTAGSGYRLASVQTTAPLAMLKQGTGTPASEQEENDKTEGKEDNAEEEEAEDSGMDSIHINRDSTIIDVGERSLVDYPVFYVIPDPTDVDSVVMYTPSGTLTMTQCSQAGLYRVMYLFDLENVSNNWVALGISRNGSMFYDNNDCQPYDNYILEPPTNNSSTDNATVLVADLQCFTGSATVFNSSTVTTQTGFLQSFFPSIGAAGDSVCQLPPLSALPSPSTLNPVCSALYSRYYGGTQLPPGVSPSPGGPKPSMGTGSSAGDLMPAGTLAALVAIFLLSSS